MATKKKTIKKAAKKTTKKKVPTRKKATKKKTAKKTVNLNEGEFNQVTAKRNDSPKGGSGTRFSSNKLKDDHIPGLEGISGQEFWAKMLRSDTQVRKIYHAVVNPIRSAKWSVPAVSDDAQDIAIAALLEQILFKDLPGGFKKKLNEMLDFPFKGFSLFEKVHANKISKKFGAYTGLANLAWRDPRTLVEFEHDKTTEELTRVHQKNSGDLEKDVWMDADTLLIFYNEQKGKDLGFAFCRMLYGPYKRKLLAKELQIIGTERSAISVPHLKLPPDVKIDSPEAQEAEAQLEAFTNAEQAYFMTPHGWDLEYNANSTFDPSKIQTVIKSENEEMAGSVVAMFLEMGVGGNSGNQAGVEGSINFFNKGLLYLADNIAETINTCLIPELVAMNFGEVETLPELTHSGISEDAGKELMEIVTGYVEKAVLTPDEILEDHVRKAHNLPKKAEGEQADNKTAADDTTPPDDSNTETKPEEEVELADKNAKTPKSLITVSGERVSTALRESLQFTSDKYIADIMRRYADLPKSKKQRAPKDITPGGTAKLRKRLSTTFTDITNEALIQVRKEVPSKSDIKLSNKNEKFITRFETMYEKDISEIKLNEHSKLPSHIQALIATQADLMTKASAEELTNRIAFQFSSSEVSTTDPEIIKKDLEDASKSYIESAQIDTKGSNVSATLVNESRDTFFFQDDVLDEIHSFTFTNPDPKTLICRELTGVVFETNDVESLRFSPPLHHNCKSYLRANLKSSRGVDQLDVSTLSPTAKAKEGITI